jgi:hypothetical protein
MRRPEWTRCSGARPRDCDQECDPPEGRRATKVPLTRSGRRDSNPRPPPWQGSWGGLVTCGDGAICTLSSAFSIPCNPVVSRRFSVVDGTPTGPLLQRNEQLDGCSRPRGARGTNRTTRVDIVHWKGVSNSGTESRFKAGRRRLRSLRQGLFRAPERSSAKCWVLPPRETMVM